MRTAVYLQLFSLLFSIISCPPPLSSSFFFFFFNDTATTEIYTLSLHDALPIYARAPRRGDAALDRGSHARRIFLRRQRGGPQEDRKSTRLNSSHQIISYAVFCLKKKKKRNTSSLAINTHTRHIHY